MLGSRTLLMFLAVALNMSTVCLGQIGGGFGGGLGGGIGGGNNQNSSGIQINADGVLNLVVTQDTAGSLDKKRRELLLKKSDRHDFHKRSKLRLVSLVELEKKLNEILSEQKSIPEELFYLAGLQRIDHLFVFPDEKDVCIGGPAEAYVPDAVGRMIGIESGRPTLRLDDLAIALRTVGKSQQLGCSIDPVPQRLAELQKFIRQAEPASVDEVEARFNQMDDILGLQNVRIDGVPPDSHFATILVEADYRMKRIAIGLENPQVKGFKSYLATLGTKGNSMQRWWFVPFYDSISRSDDGMAYQFVGQRAQLLTEEEVVDAEGNRSSAATTQKSIQAFAKQFTEKFPQLADKSPIFAELQNLIDWSIVSALMIKERISERIGWKQDLFLDAERLSYPSFDVPRKVPSQVSYKRIGNQVVGNVCGGVVVHPQQSYDKIASTANDSTNLKKIRSNAANSARSIDHHWWWDAAR